MRREVLVPTSGGHKGISFRIMGIALPYRYPSKIHVYLLLCTPGTLK